MLRGFQHGFHACTSNTVITAHRLQVITEDQPIGNSAFTYGVHSVQNY